MTDQRAPKLQDTLHLQRVLIVDDRRDAALLIAKVLTEEGYEVEVAHNGLVAVTLAVAFNPQVALLDISLPGIDGYQLAARLRAQPQLRNCRLIAISGHCSEQDRARSAAAGFESHLAKPLSLGVLLIAVSTRESPALAAAALG